jgi:hypothetical protein
MRPRYEVPTDRANEYQVLARFAQEWELFIDYRNAETGLTLLLDKQGNPVLFAEVKCRNNPAFKFETLNISVKKIAHAERQWQINHLPTLLIVQFTDHTLCTQLHPVKVPFPVGLWGRDDRNDPADIEPAAKIPMSRFRSIRA